MAQFDDVKHMTSLGLESNIETASEDRLFFYHRGIKGTKITAPILVLIHGYPQTNYIWRNIIPALPADIPLFIPDIPGYGRSPPLSVPHSKQNQGQRLLEALARLAPNSQPCNLVVCGHDRGARIAHRLAVSCPNAYFTIKGSVFLDIVPSLVQYQSFASPSAAVGTYHWPFLANPEVAVPMILATGDFFIKTCIYRWGGKSAVSVAGLESDNAVQIYCRELGTEAAVKASCDDYRAGAHEDIAEQEKDQRDGKKIDGDILVVYSEHYLGSRYNMKEVWEQWTSGKGKLEIQGVGHEVGHFMAEEAPKETATQIVQFYANHSK